MTTNDEITRVLSEYEAALQEQISEGGDEAEAEYERARGALLDLLRAALSPAPCNEQRPCDMGAICIACQPRQCPDARPRVDDWQPPRPDELDAEAEHAAVARAHRTAGLHDEEWHK